MSDTLYVVYRVFKRSEREDPKERSVFYGWTSSKKVLDVFMKQRNPKKYKYYKLTKEDRDKYKFYPDTSYGDEYMIDFIRLRTSSNREEVLFFSTPSETKEAEIKIQEKFHNMCSIPDMRLLKLYMHLDGEYLEALELLGFKPKEIDMVYDTSDNMDNYNTLDLALSEIEDAYDGVIVHPPEDHERFECAPGLLTLSQVGDKLLYSLDNFVSVLINDL